MSPPTSANSATKCQEAEPSQVLAGSREALDQPGVDRIGCHRDDDGDRLGRVLGGERRRRGRGKDEIDRAPDKLPCKIREAVSLLVCPPILDGNVSSLNPAEVSQTLPEGLAVERRPRIRRKIGDARDWLLRHDGGRYGEEDDESYEDRVSYVSHIHLRLNPAVGGLPIASAANACFSRRRGRPAESGSSTVRYDGTSSSRTPRPSPRDFLASATRRRNSGWCSSR